MLQKLRKLSIFTLLIVTLLPAYMMVSSQSVLGQAGASCDLATGNATMSNAIFVPWYKYLEGEETGDPPKCTIKEDDWVKMATLVGMAIIELLMRVGGLIAVGFIIWGGIQYTTSQGEPEGLKNAKDTISNAIIGFIIIVLAIGIVQFIGSAIR